MALTLALASLTSVPHPWECPGRKQNSPQWLKSRGLSPECGQNQCRVLRHGGSGCYLSPSLKDQQRKGWGRSHLAGHGQEGHSVGRSLVPQRGGS